MLRINRLRNILPLSIGLGMLLFCLSVVQFTGHSGRNNPYEGETISFMRKISVNKNELTEQINYYYNRQLPREPPKGSGSTTNIRPDTQTKPKTESLDDKVAVDEALDLTDDETLVSSNVPEVDVVPKTSKKGSPGKHISSDSNSHQQNSRWEPLISLHSVKHIFGIDLPETFVKEKISNLSRTYDMETDKKKKQNKEPETPESDVCPFYFNDTTVEKTVLPRFYGKCSTGYKPDDVTLLIQMDTSHGYFRKLREVTNYWSGPVSVALFINATKDVLLNSELNIQREMKEIFDKYSLHDTAICVHIVSSGEGLHFYPVNTMRNVAIKYAQTDLVFLIEADFIPMPQLNQVFQRTWLKRNLNKRKLAYIVPSFSMESDNHSIPLSKSQLLKQWQRNVTIPIHYSKSFKSGHKPTDYKRYAYANKTYKVNYQKRYEPYYVVNRKKTPYYPEEFLHGFKDKSVHATILNDTGFEFHVLPNTYVVHTPHVMPYERDASLFQCALIALDDFTNEFNDLNKRSSYRL